LNLNASGLFPKNIGIKEKMIIEERENGIEELLKKKLTREDIKKLSQEFKDKVVYYKDLYQQFRGCPMFDVKIIELAEAYSDLKNIVENYQRMLNNINIKLTEIQNLQDSISRHEIFTLQYPFEVSPISAIILNWIKQKFGSAS
jgi:sulfur relay (sulfurtransferase) DsrC/TusE family protein